MQNHQKWILLIGSIAITTYLIYSRLLDHFIEALGSYGIIGVFISGLFFGYAFTVIPATTAIIYLSSSINPLLVSFVGALGTMIGDLILFKYIKNALPDEIEHISQKRIRKIKKSKFKWLIPGIASLIIASPFPDELGITLLGAIKFKTSTFMLISFILNFIGLLIITGFVSLLWNIINFIN